MKPSILLGFDIETGGPIIGKHPLLAIGLCVHKLTKHGLELLDTCEVHLHADENEYKESTLEFWKKHPDAWDTIKQHCIPPQEAAKLIIDFIQRWQCYAKGNNLTYKVITDNCWFDNAFLSYFLSQYGGLPMSENYIAGYIKLDNMIDVNQRINALTTDLGKCLDMKSFVPSVPHDHAPFSDAIGIVEKYVYYLRKVSAFRI